MPEKWFRLQSDEFRQLASGRGGCYATDHITVEGYCIGYMYRDQPEVGAGFFDSGRRFFSGRESDEYANDPDNIAIYDVNTIANYDPAIIPLLDAPPGSAFAREAGTGEFVPEAFSVPED